MKSMFNSFTKFLTLGLAVVGLFTLPASAQVSYATTTATLSPATPNSALAGRYAISSISFINSAASTANIKLYDQATATTNQVRPAYTYVSSSNYTYSVVFTNQFGLVDTNYFPSIRYYNVSSAAVTNEATQIANVSIPASATTPVDINYISSLGLVLLANTNVTAVITYRTVTP